MDFCIWSEGDEWSNRSIAYVTIRLPSNITTTEREICFHFWITLHGKGLTPVVFIEINTNTGTHNIQQTEKPATLLTIGPVFLCYLLLYYYFFFVALTLFNWLGHGVASIFLVFIYFPISNVITLYFTMVFFFHSMWICVLERFKCIGFFI